MAASTKQLMQDVRDSTRVKDALLRRMREVLDMDPRSFVWATATGENEMLLAEKKKLFGLALLRLETDLLRVAEEAARRAAEDELTLTSQVQVQDARYSAAASAAPAEHERRKWELGIVHAVEKMEVRTQLREFCETAFRKSRKVLFDDELSGDFKKMLDLKLKELLLPKLGIG